MVKRLKLLDSHPRLVFVSPPRPRLQRGWLRNNNGIRVANADENYEN